MVERLYPRDQITVLLTCIDMKKVTSEGGEGLILRKPGSLYTSGRSDSFLKVKVYPEVDVRFIRLHEHRTYGVTLLCELPNGDQCT
jgi:DNA ligase-1